MKVIFLSVRHKEYADAAGVESLKMEGWDIHVSNRAYLTATLLGLVLFYTFSLIEAIDIETSYGEGCNGKEIPDECESFLICP